jgi:hypothetical protein
MEGGQLRGERADQIDFPVLWVSVRGAQILLAVIFTKQTYLSIGTDSFGLDLFSSIGFLLLFGLFVHRIVTGVADSSGIHYRRYFRMKTVSWNDVQEIQWVKSRLRVLIKKKSKRRRTLVFLLNPLKAEGAYLAHRLGAEVDAPEILERIHALPIETPPSITSAPPYPKWILRAFLVVVVLFVLVFLWKLLSAASHISH